MHNFSTSVFDKISANASLADVNGGCLQMEFEDMAAAGMLKVGLPRQAFCFEDADTPGLLQLLKQTGKANLSVGRIYEGHVNAMQLVHVYGTTEQRRKWFGNAVAGELFGVWNTEDAEGLKLYPEDNNTYRIEGCKTFCSGAGIVHHPLVTAALPGGGWQMCIMPSEHVEGISIDKSFWKPMGMKASASYRVRFENVIINGDDLLGQPDNYYRQPYFSGGAIRFAAVQLGGAAAMVEETINFLRQLNRVDDPFQKARVAEMLCALETGDLWLQSAGKHQDNWITEISDHEKMVAYANMTRTVIESTCLKIMQLAERSVGARGLLQNPTIERVHRDLTMYLRQPAPDAALTNISSYIFNQPANNDHWT